MFLNSNSNCPCKKLTVSCILGSAVIYSLGIGSNIAYNHYYNYYYYYNSSKRRPSYFMISNNQTRMIDNCPGYHQQKKNKDSDCACGDYG